ncbi:hypothetical protein BS47DRAFT_361760 [Hydnum rufescens UP504]|uniref:Pali-domain-containing protein n=1 Tax=Hydnum rufescens UP504 TaxID=1448309 RepID=A0A9P6AJI2_9AGAM|nr:hypothetical protein BS47DRAFT_361760 [Hydnum rufescens UP504]
MGILRPATPGFLTTLAATILLIVVSFCVPYFKSIYFLKASLATSGVSGSITLGTLGYCFELSGNTTCSKPRVGYEFDPNALLGNDTRIQIPQVVVKWLTYALVLHLVAMGLAAISACFGLLAHVREMSMSCFSSCISGFAAVIALLAFIFDIAFFFVVKSRINHVQGGRATIGNAIWLTLAAWILLFFSGWVFALGRCCISNRSRKGKHEGEPEQGVNPNSAYAETMRLNAVKAEADRKAQQLAGTYEVGLPAHEEYERQPLRSDPQYMEEEHSPYVDIPAQTAEHAVGDVRRQPSGYTIGPGHGRQPTAPGGGPYPGGYVRGPPGGRAVDGLYGTAPVRDAPLAELTAIGATNLPAHHQRRSGSETAQTHPPQPLSYPNVNDAAYGNQPRHRRPSTSETGQGYHPQQPPYQDVHYNPYGNQPRHRGPSGAETGQGYPQPQSYQDTGLPYGAQPSSHAPAYDPYAPATAYANAVPAGQPQYPSSNRPADTYVAPYGSPSTVSSQPSSHRRNNTLTPPEYDSSTQSRSPAEGSGSSYFHGGSSTRLHHPQSHSSIRTSSSGPSSGLSPLSTIPSPMPPGPAYGGVTSPVSPGNRQTQAVRGPRDDGANPLRRGPVTHNLGFGRRAEDEQTVISEAPPRYDALDPVNLENR